MQSWNQDCRGQRYQRLERIHACHSGHTASGLEFGFLFVQGFGFRVSVFGFDVTPGAEARKHFRRHR